MARLDLTDFEWSVIAPLLPTKVRGVARVDDRRVLNGIFWRLRTGAPWADIPQRYGPHTTCVNRFNRWRKAGVWDRILTAVSKAYDGDIQMIDSSSIRVHQHAAIEDKVPDHSNFSHARMIGSAPAMYFGGCLGVLSRAALRPDWSVVKGLRSTRA
jgi:putative transposase